MYSFIFVTNILEKVWILYTEYLFWFLYTFSTDHYFLLVKFFWLIDFFLIFDQLKILFIKKTCMKRDHATSIHCHSTCQYSSFPAYSKYHKGTIFVIEVMHKIVHPNVVVVLSSFSWKIERLHEQYNIFSIFCLSKLGGQASAHSKTLLVRGYQ